MDAETRAISPRPPVGFYLLLALIALCAGGKAILYDTIDPDCFWHLRVADQLHHDGIGPIVDHLSFSSSPEPWTPYSWLAELGMKAVWDIAGFRGAIAVQAITQSLIIILIALACLEMQRHPTAGGQPRYFPVIASTAVAAYLSLAYFSFRPVTFAFLILSACTWLILRDRRMNEKSRAVWWIVPLTAVLTNIHLFSFFIPAVVFAMLGGSIIERLQSGTEAPKPDPVRRYSLMLWMTTAAFFATPMLPGLFKTIFYYGTKDQMVAGPVISEMQSFARGPMGTVAAIIVAGIISAAIFYRKRIRPGELICFVVGTLLLFKLGRFSPIFAMIACPVLATTFPPIQDRVLFKPAIQFILAVVLIVGTVRVGSAFPRHQTLSAWLNRHGPEAPGYPAAAADYVLENVHRNNKKIVNEFSWGGYLEWQLQGKYQVLLDGRTQVFPAKLWHDTYLGSEGDREKFLSMVTADAAILPKTNSLFRSALEKSGWTTAYKDDRAEVMLPPIPIASTAP